MIELREVRKSFGAVVAVDGVSFGVRKGEFCSLLGPSGCGKTTLLRMIAGFEHPDSGAVVIAGADAVGIPAYRRNLAMVFQGYALFPHRTVLKNVMFGLRVRRLGSRPEILKRAREALQLVGLEGLENRYPRELSGGQQQRVALARAVAVRPAVLLLDEPLGALDLKLRKAMRYELKRLQRTTGITTIYVTHDQEEAMSMSDTVIVMNSGRVEQIGSPAEIYHGPITGFVAEFIGESNFFTGTVRSVDADGAGLVEVPELRHTFRFAYKPNSTGPRPGDEVGLVLRAERITIAAASTDRAGIRGRVVERQFLGAVTRVFVQPHGSNTMVIADLPSRLGDRVSVIDDEVTLDWADSDLSLVIRRKGAGAA